MQTLSVDSTQQTLRLERPVPTRPFDRFAMRAALWLLLWSTRTRRVLTAEERCARHLAREQATRTAEQHRAHVASYSATLPR